MLLGYRNGILNLGTSRILRYIGITSGFWESHTWQGTNNNGAQTTNISKLRLYGLDTGDKFASKQFLTLVEFCAAKQLEFDQADRLMQPLLPGIGVKSPVALRFDGCTIGDGSLFSRHEALEIIVMSSIDTVTGKLRPNFLACHVHSNP